MNATILLKDLSESKIDKVIVNDQVKAGWMVTFCRNESFWFTMTNCDNSSLTGGNCQ